MFATRNFASIRNNFVRRARGAVRQVVSATSSGQLVVVLIQYSAMRRADGLIALSRREFCGGLATCLGLATLAGCVDGETGVVNTGPLGGPEGSNGDHPPDAGTTPSDGGVIASCPASGATDVGAASGFVANTPRYFATGNFWVVRDAGGLYALTARCTHEGWTTITSGGVFYCQKHGAKFDYNGGIITGPVITGLVHYAMCTMANGHVGVVTSQTVAKTQRLVA